MPGLQREHIGIRPPGALGVALYFHLSRRLSDTEGLFFMLRPRSASARAIHAAGGIRIATSTGVQCLPESERCLPDLPSCWDAGTLPELILACPNPDQLLGILDETVTVVERAHAARRLDESPPPVPLVVLCSNGIYFQRLRQLFIERLEESTLLGRLPDLWPDIMPVLVGRLMRGVTIQTGTREEVEGRTIYRPGPPAITYLAGGDVASRQRAGEVLRSRGGWYEVIDGASATRLEFDKAMVNLVSNLLGQLVAIDAEGYFRPLTVEEVYRAVKPEDIRELVGHVLEVGRAVRVYGDFDTIEAQLQRLERSVQRHRDHVPSSLQWLELKLKHSDHRAELTPTEAWLLDPLIRYSRASGLEGSARYFERLREMTLAKLAAAHHWHAHQPSVR